MVNASDVLLRTTMWQLAGSLLAASSTSLTDTAQDGAPPEKKKLISAKHGKLAASLSGRATEFLLLP